MPKQQDFKLLGKLPQDVLEEEMRIGRFGRCAFRCDNDVADRQVVTLTATDGILLTIEMNALTRREGRETVISGTRGEISVAGQVIEVRDRSGVLIRTLDFSREAALPYHANADLLLVEDFIHSIAIPGRQPAVTLDDSLESHRICFLAG